MSDRTCEVALVSHHGRDDVYAELSRDNLQWGEVRFDSEQARLKVTIFPSLSGKAEIFDYEELIETLGEARRRLLDLEGIEEKSKKQE